MNVAAYGVQRYVGTCDVCEQPIALDFDWRTGGTIDHAIDDDGRIYTWIRHIGGPDPRCAIYSSAVYEVPWPRLAAEPLNAVSTEGTLGALRELTYDLPDSTPIVVVMRKRHDPDRFYEAVRVDFESVALTFSPVVVLEVPEPEDLDG